MLGVFMSLDLLIFFVFWEIGLVPMYFLINQWGSEKGEREIWKGVKVQARNYASLKFIIYHHGWFTGTAAGHPDAGCVIPKLTICQCCIQKWNSLTTRLHLLRSAGRDCQNDCLLGVCDRLCHQSPGLAFPYLAAGCPYRSSDCRFDDPGGCAC